MAQTTKRKRSSAEDDSDEQIQPSGDWRVATLSKMRRLIQEAAPDIVEERKWRKPTNPEGVPVWSHGGIVCTGETYKQVVKLTFARGAALKDPQGLFNSSLEGNTRRAIDIREGESVDAGAFKALIQAAVAENLRSGASKPNSSKAEKAEKAKASPSAGEAKRVAGEPKPAIGKAKPAVGPPKSAKPAEGTAKPGKPARAVKPAIMPEGEKGGVVLLSGGNPQIAKGDGDTPVQAYIAAMPGWKSGLGRQLDSLIVRHVPGVRKAVKWNSPFYGVEGQGWFVSFHVFTHYVKVTFFAGTSLQPIPPGGTPKSKEVRWIDIHEGEFDEAQMAAWVKQAAALPGWTP